MKRIQVLKRLSRAASVVVERMEDRRMFSALSPSTSQLVFSTIETGASGGSPSAPQTLTLTDTGATPLTISSIVVINDPNSGTADSSAFAVNSSGFPSTLSPGQSANLTVTFSTANTAIRSAVLQIQSNDPTNPTLNVSLRGLGTAGYYDNLQPGLQTILNLYQLPIVTGDPTPNTAYFNGPANTPNDEIIAQQFTKAGAGPVTITPLAVYNIGSPVAERLGYYVPGSPNDKTELFTIDGSTPANEQTVNPNPLGATSFDPGSASFGLYAAFPHFIDNGHERVSYSESALNTWDSNNHQKMRAYPLKDSTGTVVPNAYVVAFEDYDLAYYDTSMIAIVRNVKPVAAGPVLGLQSLQATASTDRLVFNRIQNLNTSDPQGFVDTVDNTATLQINNTGSQPLVINGLTLSDSANWQIVNPPAPGTIVAANGGILNVTIKFIATTAPVIPYNQTNDTATTDGTPVLQAGGVWNGTLTINSNDPTTPTRTVQLAGYFQLVSEHEMEPGLQTLTNLAFGYGTTISNAQQTNYNNTANNGTAPTYYGEEVASGLWNVADPSQQVSVLQLAAFHNQFDMPSQTYPGTTLAWYPQGSGYNVLFRQAAGNSQSLLPNLYGTTNTPAAGSFSPAGAFGFNIDGEYSQDSLNTADISAGRSGHAVRFYPVRDGGGNLVPNTWLMVMDYENGSYDNGDFQDNVYLVTNMRPATQAPAVADLQAVGAANGVALQWAPVWDANLVGYNVYSSSSPTGTFTKLNATPITRTSFTDPNATAGAPTYYRVTAVDSAGESQAANASAQPLAALSTTLVSADINSQPAGATTVVTPGSAYTVTAGGADIAGTNADGFRYVYQQVNGDFDAVVQISSLSQNVLPSSRAGLMARESLDSGSRMVFDGATASNGYRFNYRSTEGQIGVYNTVGNVTYPNAWVRLVRKGNEFSTYSSADGINWTLLGTLEMALPSTVFLGMAVSSHSATQTVTAQFQNYSVAATAAPAAPATPANLTASAALAGVALQWTAGTDANLTGYNVYSSTSATGPFTKLNANLLTSPSYNDTAAAGNTLTYYQVFAVNSSNLSSTPATISATRPSANGSPNIFTSASAPASNLQNINDPTITSTGGVELGVKFRSDVAGTITGVRFYKGSLAAGTQTGELWSSAGQLLATATFTNESASGWQQVSFANPVSIAANTTYIVSYHTTAPYLAYTPNTFSAAGIDNNPLHALANGVDGNNGVYHYDTTPGVSSFPNLYNGQAPNYWVDVVFGTTAIVGPSAPSAPAGLTATAPSSTQVTLGWTASTGTVTAYHVERSTNGGAFVEIAGNVQTVGYTDNTVQANTAYTYQVRAENSGAFSAYSNTQQVSTPLAATSIFASSSAPAAGLQNINDPSIPGSGGVELGVKFRSDVSGTITGVRFWKGSLNTGTHTGELWSSTGQLLATATFTNESASGWQQVTFSTPVTIAANTTYIVSYHTTAAYIAYGPSQFASGGVDNAPLHALANGVDGNNGIYKYGPSGFPSVYNGQAPSYWVDVVFNPSGQTTPVAPSAPTALAATPTAGGPVSLSWTASTGTVTAYHVERSTNGGAFVEIAAGVQGTTYTDSAVQSGTSYTYQVRAENSGVFSGYSNAQQVTTAAAVATSSIFSSASGPTAGFQNVNDNSIPGAGGVELGVKFRSDVSGTITGVRFWKGSLNTGTHTGELWSSTGQLLATATFTNESASGWQQVTFSNPVAIAANTTYIVSYHTNAAYLAYTPSTFASSGVDNGTLHALGNGVDGNNSVYKYGASSFPTVYNGQAPNYWVDVVFAATPAPLTLTSLDIGASPAGSTTVVTPGVDYNVSAGGPAIYGNSDGFRFVYEQLTGNFDIAVQVQSMTVAGATAQAGLMARTSLDAASQEVSVTTSPSSGYRFKDRDTTGGITNFTTVNGPTVYPNVWVRLQRAGNVFTGYYSTDGINWTLTGTVNLALPNTLYVGLAAASNNTTDLTTVQFRGFGNTAS